MSYATGLRCVRCHHQYPIDKIFTACPSCFRPGSTASLSVTYDYEKIRNGISRVALSRRPSRTLWKYKELLPVDRTEHMLEVGDGGTPLVNAARMAKKIGVKHLYLKDESRNLTWSFKDRLACVGVGKALDFGAKVVTCLSTGNHGAASAAHASAAGLPCVVFTVPYIPRSMLIYMMMCGAKVVSVKHDLGLFGDFPYSLMQRCVRQQGWYPLTTYVLPPAGNPYGVEGYKTIGYEICEQLGWELPDVIVFPTGHGEGFSGTWKGFREMYELGLIASKPFMAAVQPHGAAPLVEAIKGNHTEVPRIVAKPTLQFSTGVNTTSLEALIAIRESRGTAVTVDDVHVARVQRELGRLEGIFAEQSSASSVAAVENLLEEGFIDSNATVVCVITSGGLKDVLGPGRSLPRVTPISEDWEAFRRFMRLTYDLEV